MHLIKQLEEKHYYLFDIEEDCITGTFHDWDHVLNWFYHVDLRFVGHNKHDTIRVKEYITHIPFVYLKPITYILLDFNLKVVSKDLLVKGIESYQKTYPNPYRAIKRGTNRKGSWNGYRHTTRFYKNTVAMLVGDKREFPLNKRDVLKRNRLFEWDTSRRSNKGSSWKTKKNKKQWMKGLDTSIPL